MNDILSQLDSISGYQIVIRNDDMTKKQKIKLSAGYQGTKEFADQFNSWLADRFGFDYPTFVICDKTIVMHNDVYQKIKQLNKFGLK